MTGITLVETIIDFLKQHSSEDSCFVFGDVGAAGGIPSRWSQIRDHVHVLAFEPDTKAFEKLMHDASSNTNRTYYNSALLDRQGFVDFHVTRKRECSSIFRPNREFVSRFPDSSRFDVVSSHQIKLDKLDDIVKAHEDLDGIDFLKVDAQGSELQILKGALDVLQNTVLGVEIEAEFQPMYCGQPLFADIDSFMREMGFGLFDLKRYFWSRNTLTKMGAANQGVFHPKGQIIFADTLYLVQVEKLFSAGFVSELKVLKAVLIAVLYGYLDFALEIILTIKEKHVLDERTSLQLERLILEYLTAQEKISSGRLRNILRQVPGTRRLARLVYKLCTICSPDVVTFKGPFSSDLTIGAVLR